MVELTIKNRPDGQRFLVKDYPKDREWRRLQLADHLMAKLRAHIADNRLCQDQLLFVMSQPNGPRRYRIPEVLPDPETGPVGQDAGEQSANTAEGVSPCLSGRSPLDHRLPRSEECTCFDPSRCFHGTDAEILSVNRSGVSGDSLV